jgi:RHS repeat-associated protein
VSGSLSPNTFQFTARENDGDGLYYYRARYYSPARQRFINQDPIGFAGGLNVYAYANNNPLGLRDPFGLCSDPGGAGIRYCIQAYIPEPQALGIYAGDDRQHTCSDPTGTKNYRAFQWITNGSGGVDPGITRFRGTGITGKGLQGDNSVTPLSGRKDRRKGFNVRNSVTNGLAPPGTPPLGYDIDIVENQDGSVSVDGTGTGFPDIEVCQYGSSGGTQGIHFPHQGGPDGFTGPLHLYNTRSLSGTLK